MQVEVTEREKMILDSIRDHSRSLNDSSKHDLYAFLEAAFCLVRDAYSEKNVNSWFDQKLSYKEFIYELKNVRNFPKRIEGLDHRFEQRIAEL